MTPEEQAAYNDLSRSAEALAAKADAHDKDGIQGIIAAIASIMARLGMIAAASKSQLDELSNRARNRDRGSATIRDERALRFFAELKPEDRERLVRAVESGTPNASVKAFADNVASQANLSPFPILDVVQWVGNYYSYLAQRETEEDVNRVVSILLDPLDSEASTKELLAAADSSNASSLFVQHIKRLLRCHSTLGITLKAEQLAFRSERQFVYATLATDMRPVFSGNVEAAPVYGVVLHNLLLGVDEGGTTRTINVALSSTDILTLGQVLDRAYKKESTLRKHSAYKILPLR